MTACESVSRLGCRQPWCLVMMVWCAVWPYILISGIFNYSFQSHNKARSSHHTKMCEIIQSHTKPHLMPPNHISCHQANHMSCHQTTSHATKPHVMPPNHMSCHQTTDSHYTFSHSTLSISHLPACVQAGPPHLCCPPSWAPEYRHSCSYNPHQRHHRYSSHRRHHPLVCLWMWMWCTS